MLRALALAEKLKHSVPADPVLGPLARKAAGRAGPTRCSRPPAAQRTLPARRGDRAGAAAPHPRDLAGLLDLPGRIRLVNGAVPGTRTLAYARDDVA